VRLVGVPGIREGGGPSAEGTLCIGTSGWHYEHWRGPFYPSDLPSARWLEFYGERFEAVEINNSFYRLPEVQTLNAWGNAVPEGFVFAVKASRYITHMKKLRDAGDPARRFLARVETLGDRLGPVLFQLPPHWRANPDRLGEFLAELPGGHRYAFEFRDPTWFDPRVYEILAEAGAALCIFDLAGETSPKEVTANLVYVRLHGPGKAYQGRYDAQVLAGWAGALSTWRRQGCSVHCYFDNDQAGHAAEDALRLKEMLSG
jgi:uncharacterized protein YecE (DUF72 family)